MLHGKAYFIKNQTIVSGLLVGMVSNFYAAMSNGIDEFSDVHAPSPRDDKQVEHDAPLQRHFTHRNMLHQMFDGWPHHLQQRRGPETKEQNGYRQRRQDQELPAIDVLQ